MRWHGLRRFCKQVIIMLSFNKAHQYDPPSFLLTYHAYNFYHFCFVLDGLTISVDSDHSGSMRYGRAWGQRSRSWTSLGPGGCPTAWEAYIPETGHLRCIQASSGHHVQKAARSPPGTRWTSSARPGEAWALGWGRNGGGRSEASVFTLPFHCCFSLSSVTTITSSRVLRLCYFFIFDIPLSQCINFYAKAFLGIELPCQ